MNEIPGQVQHTGTVRENWWQFMLFGVLLLILGLVAVFAPIAATVYSVYFFGGVLIIAGIVQVIKAFTLRGTDGFWVALIAGIIAAVIGTILLTRPIGTIVTLTLFMAIYFLVSGLFRVIGGLASVGLPSSGFVVLNGIVNLILGGLILAGWPSTALWVIGLFIGIDLIFAGIWAMSIGSMLHTAVSGRPSRYPA